MAKASFDLQERLVSSSVFTIGSVFKVQGKEIVVEVNKDKNLPHLFFNGRTVKNVSVGMSNYIKITKGFIEIICKVEGEYLEKEKYQVQKKTYINEKEKINRYLNVSVFGFYDNDHEFQHGIKEMPLIGSECKLLSREEFEELHQLSKAGELSVPLGCLVDEETQAISIAVKKLFSGHIGIFGNTGSGKSNTLAKLYTELFRLKDLNDNFTNKSRFVFIDFNGEYSRKKDDHILTANKTVYSLKTKPQNGGDKYPIHKSELEKLELLSILLDATEKTQQPFLHRALDTKWFEEDNQKYQKEMKSINEKLKKILLKKSPNFGKPFLEQYVGEFERLGFEIVSGDNLSKIGYNSGTYGFYYPDRTTNDNYINDENVDEKLFSSNVLNVSVKTEMTDIQKIQFKIFDRYYHEVLEGYINQEYVGYLMGRISKRFKMLEKVIKVVGEDEPDRKNIEIVNLRNVNLEIKKVIPMLVCKANYDQQKELRESNDGNSLHIIIDEAHNILSDASARESDSWKDYRLETFEEIIKEGRKFGAFMTIASQRPSDISTTIISQLHNYFIHKLMNDNDLLAIKRAVSYLDRLSFDSISNLSTGCCFIAGQMTQFPLSVKVALLEPEEQPKSETINLDKLWRK